MEENGQANGRPSRWDAWGNLRSLSALFKSPFSLIYKKLGEGGSMHDDDGKAHVGVVGVAEEGLEVKVKEGRNEDDEESSDEEIEKLQHAAPGGGTCPYVSQPHQWEKVDFATFSWCKVSFPRFHKKR
jgi:hypothetical protein